MEYANEIIFEEFYPYRTSRRNCHYCDSCRNASPGPEFSKAEIIRRQLCFQLQADQYGNTWNNDIAYENNWLVLLWPHLKNQQFPKENNPKISPAICPGGKDSDLFLYENRPITNLAWNTRYGWFENSYSYRKLTRCKQPTKAATLWDVSNIGTNGAEFTATANSRDYTNANDIRTCTSMRHSGGTDNILFVDGHVESRNIMRLADQQQFRYLFIPDASSVGVWN